MTESSPLRHLAVLRRNPWFARLAPPLQKALLDEAEIRDVAAGKWLYGTGDSPRGVFTVLEGAVLSYVTLPRGDDVLVHVAMPGEVFGHAARLGQGPRLATMLAAEPSVFLYLPEAGLDRVARTYPELWPSLTRLLYQQLGALLVLLAQTQVLPARARLALRLLQLGGAGPSPRLVCIPQAQLAELVGVSRKTVNQLLGELAQSGFLVKRSCGIEIVDREGLTRIARDDAPE